MEPEIRRSEDEWKKILSPEEFRILRKKGTEPAFSGKYAASTCVPPASRSCSPQKRNMIQAVAGPVSGRPYPRIISKSSLMTVCYFIGQRWYAAGVAVTSGMFSMTVPDPRDCDSA